MLQSYRHRTALRIAKSAILSVTTLALLGCIASEPKEPTTFGPTIVSLNPCSDAVLAKVTRPGQLLAVSHFSHEVGGSSMGVAEGRRYPAVSGSVEEIARISPDIVVADVFLPPATEQAIRDLGIRVVTIGNINSVADSLLQVRQLSEVSRNIDKGQFLVGDIEDAILKFSSVLQAEAKPISAIVWQSGGIVAGDNTLIAELLRLSGFFNAAAVRGMRQADYLPLEAMLAHPPEVIFAAGEEASQEDRLLSHPALSALKDTRRVAFDSALLWCGGPTIIRALEELSQVRRELSAERQKVG